MNKILFVDDDENILAAFQRQLRKELSIETALGPEQGLTALDSGDGYAVVVADMNMPGMNGVDFLRAAQTRAPDAVRVMLTGNADQRTAVEAVNEGAVFRFLTKPCPLEKLLSVLRDALRQHELITAERELLERTLRGCVKTLTDILAMADPHAFGHAQRLRDLALELARHMGLTMTWELEVAALLSPIGNITLTAGLVARSWDRQPLNPEEKRMLSRVPAIGSDLLQHIPRLEGVARVILYQDRRYDESSTPGDEVTGTQIPLHARLLKAVSDLARAERRGLTRAAAVEELRENRSWYDPEVLATVVRCFGRSTVAGQSRLEGHAIMLKEVAVGQVLAADVETVHGMLIVAAGQTVTEPLLRRLHNFASLTGVKEPLLIRIQAA